MSDQKTYKFLNEKKEEIVKTLAKPVNEKLTLLLKLIGKRSFSELMSDEGRNDYALWLLDLGLNTDSLKEALNLCLEEGAVDIDFGNLDLLQSDEVIQDFFEQRSRMYQKRLII